jgi:hypothetical protein
VADAAIVRGRILRIDGGSHAKRFWLGFGAGRASFSAEGTVTRPDGKLIGAFRERRSSSGEAQLGFARDATLLRRCLNVLGSDIAQMIDSGTYREAALHD